MKVKDLIFKLQELNEPEKEVCFDDYEWGNLSITEVAIEEYSDYEPVLLKH